MSCQLAVVFAQGEKDGRPTQFNAAIACSVKLTWTGSYLSLPSKTVAASVDKQEWEVGTNLPLRGRVSNLAALSCEGQELGGAGMDKWDCLQCP